MPFVHELVRNMHRAVFTWRLVDQGMILHSGALRNVQINVLTRIAWMCIDTVERTRRFGRDLLFVGGWSLHRYGERPLTREMRVCVAE